MRTFAKGAGATVRVPPGGIIFAKGEQGDCMYIVHSGTIRHDNRRDRYRDDRRQ